jgi:Flp pilus assembly protein TadG
MQARPARAARERGAAAVEFAILFPVLVMMLFGIIDFGRLLYAQVTLTQAAREGARQDALANSLGISTSTIQSNTAAAATNLGLTASSVTVTPCPAGSTQTTQAVVQVKYTFSFSTPLISLVGLPSTKTITGTGYMPCQG